MSGIIINPETAKNLTKEQARAVATAFLKQWLKDMCPPVDREVLDTMYDLADDELRKECERRSKLWESR
jgi:hypothetical protein